MKQEIRIVTTVSLNGEGAAEETRGLPEEPAEWLEDVDYYENGEHSPAEIRFCVCSRCGQREVGTVEEAGIFCRRCGRRMINGAPEAWVQKGAGHASADWRCAETETRSEDQDRIVGAKHPEE